MEEEFIKNQERLKPQEQNKEKERAKVFGTFEKMYSKHRESNRNRF